MRLATEVYNSEDLNETAPMEDGSCLGNWTMVIYFIDSYNPHYFEKRPLIIGGLLTLAVIGLFNNFTLMSYLLFREKVWHSGFTVLVMQLAFADSMVCLFCMLGDAVWNITIEWTGGTELCRFVKFMQMFSLYSSSMTLTGITLERCVTLMYPFTKSRPESAMFRVKVISFIVWSLATLCSVPQALIFHVERAPICTDFFQCVTFGAYTEPWQEVAYTMTSLCMMFTIPLIIIITCYVIIFAKISAEAKLASGFVQESDPRTHHSLELIHNYNRRDSGINSGRAMYKYTRAFSLWTTFIIAIVFVVCWAPYCISMTAYLFNFEISNGWMNLVLSFGTTSSVLNPVIYGVFKILHNKRETLHDRFIRDEALLHFAQQEENSEPSERTNRRSSVFVSFGCIERQRLADV